MASQWEGELRRWLVDQSGRQAAGAQLKWFRCAPCQYYDTTTLLRLYCYYTYSYNTPTILLLYSYYTNSGLRLDGGVSLASATQSTATKYSGAVIVPSPLSHATPLSHPTPLSHATLLTHPPPLSRSFFFLFMAFNTTQALETTLLSDQTLAYATLGVLYGVFTGA